MDSPQELKDIVVQKYGQIATASGSTSCCGGSGCCGPADYSVMADDYSHLEGYAPDADLGLGCGLPTEHARISEGDTVVDLGSGAGNDCFVARALTGATGRVIGIDMTPAMVQKAIANAGMLGYTNVEFHPGDIENIPLPDNTADVVLSNCVMNLVPDKNRAFSETMRILKPGGHFSVSDIVIRGNLPEGLRQDAAMYAGCVSGALGKQEYLDIIRNAGFPDPVVQREKQMHLPEELLGRYLSPVEMEQYRLGGFGIYSITVYAVKP